jgi:hypothetical protein
MLKIWAIVVTTAEGIKKIKNPEESRNFNVSMIFHYPQPIVFINPYIPM